MTPFIISVTNPNYTWFNFFPHFIYIYIYKLNFLFFQNPGVDFGDVSERVALRKKMNCRSFRWYLEHVYPEMRIYNNTITYGEVIKTNQPIIINPFKPTKPFIEKHVLSYAVSLMPLYSCEESIILLHFVFGRF